MKYRFSFVLILSTFFLLSCSNSSHHEDDQNIEHLIPKEEMIVILADIQITEAYIDELRKSGNQINDTSMIYFKKVFKKHSITPSEFEESLLFYKKDLVKMDEMYADVITRLNELKAKNEEIIIKMKEDSIRKDSLDKVIFLTDSINKQNDTTFVTEILNQPDTNNITP